MSKEDITSKESWKAGRDRRVLGWNWRYQDELMVLSHIRVCTVDTEVVIGVAVHMYIMFQVEAVASHSLFPNIILL